MDPKDEFHKKFQTSLSALQDQTTRLPTSSLVGGERQNVTDQILTGISRLSKEVADAADYLPAYDQKVYTDAIKTLTDELHRTTTKLGPKSRFQFKPRTSQAGRNPKPDARHLTKNLNIALGPIPSASSPSAQHKSEDFDQEISNITPGTHELGISATWDIAIKDRENAHLVIPISASHTTPAGALQNLKRCVVDMSASTTGGAPFASLAMKNIEKSIVIAGHVNGPVHITGVKDSILVVVARQVRIHDCDKVDIYLYCTSHPIIEDCSGMRFAPASKIHLTERDEQEANQWNQVDDFKWLKSSHSPNWSEMPEAERLADNIWRDSVPGRPDASADDILRLAGIASE